MAAPRGSRRRRHGLERILDPLRRSTVSRRQGSKMVGLTSGTVVRVLRSATLPTITDRLFVLDAEVIGHDGSHCSTHTVVSNGDKDRLYRRQPRVAGAPPAAYSGGVVHSGPTQPTKHRDPPATTALRMAILAVEHLSPRNRVRVSSKCPARARADRAYLPNYDNNSGRTNRPFSRPSHPLWTLYLYRVRTAPEWHFLSGVPFSLSNLGPSPDR